MSEGENLIPTGGCSNQRADLTHQVMRYVQSEGKGGSAFMDWKQEISGEIANILCRVKGQCFL